MVLSTLTIVQVVYKPISCLMLKGPVFNIGNIMNDLLQGQVSLERVQKFMFADEVDTSYIDRSRDSLNSTAVKIQNGNFYWVDKAKEESTNESKKSLLDSMSLAKSQGYAGG